MAKKQDKRQQAEKDNIDTRLLDPRRVSRRYHGGRRMRFSSFAIAGDGEGKIGVATGKANDVSSAQNKAASRARKSMRSVQLKGNTIPHDIEYKFKSTIVMLKPAAPGTGIIAGSTVKTVAELVGIKDLLAKVKGSTHPINTARATVGALSMLRRRRVGSAAPQANTAEQTEQTKQVETKA